MNVQTMILTLQSFWSDQKCIILNAYDTEKGAGTMSLIRCYAQLGLSLECCLRRTFKTTSGWSIWRKSKSTLSASSISSHYETITK